MSTSSVLIVGAGPSGLALALALAHNGISVRIIDKAVKFHTGSRGAGMMPRTLEAYKFLKVLPDILPLAPPVVPLRAYKLPGGTEPAKTWALTEETEPTPSRPFTGPLELSQGKHEEILRGHLSRYGIHVELGIELVGLEQTDDFVVAHLAATVDGQVTRQSGRYAYVVGADGAKGITRKLIGASFLGETRDTDEFIVGDVEVENLGRDLWHMWKRPEHSSPMVSLRATNPNSNIFAIFMTANNMAAEDLAQPKAFREFFAKYTERTDIRLGEFRWLSHFKPNMRMVDTFGNGRVFLVGDAAHVHSPTGGQGMNSSVQDSVNIGWKIALALKGVAGNSLVSTYTEERQPVIAEMLRRTSQLHTKTFAGGELDGSEGRGWTRGRQMLMLDINYRWSPIVLDERTPNQDDADLLRGRSYFTGAIDVCAGDRAPEAPSLVPATGPGKETSLHSLFNVWQHTILIFPAEQLVSPGVLTRSIPASIQDFVQSVVILPASTSPIEASSVDGQCFIDKQGFAHSAYQINGSETRPTVFIIRPDGVIGAVIHEPAGVARYFSLFAAS